MLGANTMWGLMSPVSKLIMASGAVSPFVMTDLRVGGAMLLFWIASLFQKPEHVSPKDMVTLFFASLFAIVLNQGCFILGVSMSSPTDASIITTMKWLFTYAFICILPFSADELMATRWNELTPQTIAGILFIVIGATFISYMLIVIGQKNLRPTVAGMYNYVQPVVACIVAICCGMESLNLIKVAAVVLIFIGVYLVTVSKSRQDLENHDQQL